MERLRDPSKAPEMAWAFHSKKGSKKWDRNDLDLNIARRYCRER